MSGLKWTKEEDDLLRKLCEAGATVKDAVKVMPYRSKHGIDQRASSLNLSLAGSHPEPNFEEFKKFIKSKTGEMREV